MTTHGDGSIAVIGAGPSGLAALKNLTAQGFPCQGYESHDGPGGIWDRTNPRSSIYRNVHTITSREMTAYLDYPMDPDLPVYPRHDQVLDYLRAYAERTDLIRLISFGRAVDMVERDPAGGWRVRTDDGTVTTHRAVVIANGHN